MKKLFFAILLTALCAGLFAATFTPYGSGRVGLWYENTDADMNKLNNGVDSSRLNLNYGLQGNSRFGVNFNSDVWTSKVEFGGNSSIGLRHLWVKRQFDTWALSFGQMEDGVNQLSGQVYGNDACNIGYGVVYGNRNPAIRFDLNNGIYFGLIKPSTASIKGYGNWGLDDEGKLVDNSTLDVLIPKINVGWNVNAGKVALYPSILFQMHNYNGDFNTYAVTDTTTATYDESIMSYLATITADYNDNKFKSRLQVNFGQNTAQMGIAGPSNNAIYGVKEGSTEAEIHDTTTLGVMGQFGFDIKPTFYLGAGAGYTMSSNDMFDTDDNRMSAFVQGIFTQWGFKFIPEIGMINEMDAPMYKVSYNANPDDPANPIKVTETVKEGSMMYFGTQLRYDF